MKRYLQAILLFGIVSLFIVPAHTYAYSYGDANAEDVAETFKLVTASLSGASPDWTAAEEAYKVRRAEIVSHFGNAVGITMDQNFQVKDAKFVIANFKAVLVMNLDRRFKNAKEDINDYTKAKLLLAKAKATFETLEPYMNSKVNENKQAFEVALEALGNPGLFGVGKKEVQPTVFKEQVDVIYRSIKPMFTYTAYIKPATTVKPAIVKPEATPVSSTATEKPADETKPSVSPEAEATATATPTATPAATPVESVSPAVSISPDVTPVPVETSDNEATKEAHAPMEQTDKTNPMISFLLIGGVLLAGIGLVWFARKKGLF